MRAKTPFAERLGLLRDEKNVSQYEVAAFLGISRSAYSGYESEGKQPDYQVLSRIAAYLNTTTDYLLGLSDVAHPDQEVFLNDCKNYKQHRDALPAAMVPVADKIFDDFYIVVSRAMRENDSAKLEILARLFKSLRTGISDISLRSPSMECVQQAISAQSNAKSAVSAALDELLMLELSRAGSSPKGSNQE